MVHQKTGQSLGCPVFLHRQAVRTPAFSGVRARRRARLFSFFRSLSPRRQCHRALARRSSLTVHQKTGQSLGCPVFLHRQAVRTPAFSGVRARRRARLFSFFRSLSPRRQCHRAPCAKIISYGAPKNGTNGAASLKRTPKFSKTLGYVSDKPLFSFFISPNRQVLFYPAKIYLQFSAPKISYSPSALR